MTQTNYDEIGKITMKEMGSFHFHALNYKGHLLKKKDEKICKEFKGDCMKFIKKYLKLNWEIKSHPKIKG